MRRTGIAAGLLLCGVSFPAAAQIAALAAPGAPSAAWLFQPSFAFAYDSFGQRYVVADEDTLDLTDEMSGRLVTLLEHHGGTELRLRNSLGLGQEATRDDLQMELERRLGRLALRLDDDLRYTNYRPGSAFTVSSDYLVNTARASATLHLPSGWAARLTERFEWADFASHDRYNEDYSLHDVGAEVERSYRLFSDVRAGYSFGWRSVPDSSAIDYRRHLWVADWEHEMGASLLRLDQRLERRTYGDASVRSHFLELETGLGLRLGLRPRLRLRPEYRVSLLRYDDPDSVYADASEQSLELLVEADVSQSTVLALGPRGEFKRTEGGIERSYNQWGLAANVSFTPGSRFWLQFTEEVGLREHLAGDATLFSDYIFNWSTLNLSCSPWRDLTLDLFFSINPENHDDAASNTTTLLLSTSLTYARR